MENRIFKLVIAVCLLVSSQWCTAITTADAHDTKAILQELNKHGLVLVRSAVDPAKVEQVYLAAQQVFTALDKKVANITNFDHEKPGYATNSLRNLAFQGGLSVSHKMDKCFKLPSNYRDGLRLLLETGYLAIAQKYFADEPVLLVDGTSIRRQQPAAVNKAALGLEFHQDGSAGYPVKSGLVFWMPLTEIDAKTPTLQVVDRKMDKIYPHKGDSAGFSILADAGQVAPYQDDIVTINDMHRGDLLIFDFGIFHKTFLTDDMDKTRFSMDIRVMAYQAAIKTYQEDTIHRPYAVVASK